MPNSPQVDGPDLLRAINTLLSSQLVIAALPAGQRTAEFLWNVIDAIPGMQCERVCCFDSLRSTHIPALCDCPCWPGAGPVPPGGLVCLEQQTEDRAFYSLETPKGIYGVITAKRTSSPSAPIDAAIRNFCNAVALVLENRLQQSELKRAIAEGHRREELLDRTGGIASVGGWELETASSSLRWTKEVFRIHELEEGAQPSLEEATAFYTEESRPVIERALAEAMAQGKSFDEELRIETAKGQQRWVHTIGSAQVDSDGTVRSVVGAIQDITSRRQADMALLAAQQKAEQASRDKTRFLAAASHDLRQPLQAIISLAEVLTLGTLDDQQEGLVRNLLQSADVLASVLGQLLDAATLDSGSIAATPTALSPEALLKEVHDEFSFLVSQKKLRFAQFFPTRCPPLFVDHQLVMRLLRNLVANAVKYTETGGILVSIRRRGERALIQVWDTGIGIAPDHLSSIFQEYVQIDNPERDRSKGSGLGLSIVSRLAAIIGTEVHCRSQLGRGTVFEFSLPLMPQQSSSAVGRGERTRPLSTLSPSELPCRRVLIVEDDRDVAQALRLAFENVGLQPILFSSAEKALESPYVGEADCVVTDYRLPGMDGLQFLDALRQARTTPIRAVLITGEVSPERFARARASGWPVHKKPVRFSEILSVLKQTRE